MKKLLLISLSLFTLNSFALTPKCFYLCKNYFNTFQVSCDQSYDLSKIEFEDEENTRYGITKFSLKGTVEQKKATVVIKIEKEMITRLSIKVTSANDQEILMASNEIHPQFIKNISGQQLDLIKKIPMSVFLTGKDLGESMNTIGVYCTNN